MTYGREDVTKKSEKAGVDGFLHKPAGRSMPFEAIMVDFGKQTRDSEGVERIGRGDRQFPGRISRAWVLPVEVETIAERLDIDP
ncbi:MAG: hypothetical protein V2B18_04970 [Pseudomonadota bacterium]